MPKSLDEGFKTFIGWLEPLSSEHDKADSHKASVKSCLVNNFDCYNFFETGSFGAGTGVRHHSDTDYFAVCPSAKLHENSGTSLRRIREELEYTFPRTEGIEVKTPAVKIPFGKYASETLEVTPCTFNGMIDTPVGNKAYYDIPSYDGGWMQSSPPAHNAYVDREDKRLNGKLKPLIRLIKALKFYNNVPITSFYLELRATKYAEGENAIIYDIDIKRFISRLHSSELASLQDPMGISGYVKACTSEVKKEDALSKLATAYSRAEKAFEYREKDLDKCFYWWDMFFNGEFPSR